MGYSVCIGWMDLHSSRDISKELSEEGCWYLKYYQTEEGKLVVMDASFWWNHMAFTRDLLRLRELGVRGSLVVNDTKSNLTRYDLKGEAVEAYYAEIVYLEKPDKVYKSEEDIQKLDESAEVELFQE